MMKRPAALLVTAASLAAVTALVLVELTGRSGDDASSLKQTAAVAPQARATAGGAFDPGERAAFTLQLDSQLRGMAGTGDRFEAVLSWEVVAAPRPDEWLLRA